MAATHFAAEMPTPPLSAYALDEKEGFAFNVDVQSLELGDVASSPLRYERKMGDTELSYFLPSRQTGVNDMYLHLGFKAKACIAQRSRVCTVWSILRLRHPLLCARAEMHDYDDVRFVYDAPRTVENAYMDADANLEYSMQSKDELVDSYLNGPRTLNNSRLSYLIVSEPHNVHELMPTPPRTPSPTEEAHEPELGAAVFENTRELDDDSERERQYELLICAMHFLGDGMALHQFANDFFGLLGGSKSDSELREVLREEWRARWGTAPEQLHVLPPALEDNMPQPSGAFRRVAAKVDFELSQRKLIGGQAFPRRKHPERLTIVPTVSFPEDRTAAILKKCKAHGVSISAALFAVCNVAWARTTTEGDAAKKGLPTLMYSALNLRPYFTKQPAGAPLWGSYWYLAIGYFNVVLPSFLPAQAQALEAAFWLRARHAKEQSTRAAKNPLVASRTQEMAKERGERARAWAWEDDEREKGTWAAPPPRSPPTGVAAAMATDSEREEKERKERREAVFPARAKVPSGALIGLSLLGNLDGIYKHAAFPAVQLHTLTTGSRQRHGAMLLFGYTFKGRLWISLGYDCNGFEGDVVDRFWKEALDCVNEFLG